MTIEALIFDMDGVLIDSEPLHLLAYQQFLSEFDICFTAEDNHDFLGRKDLDCACALVEKHRLPLQPSHFVLQKEAILHELFKTQLTARPGVFDVLEQARSLSLKTAVASSATLPTIQLVVDILKIGDYFSSLTSGDEVAHGKPAPDVFLLAAERLGVKPERCLVIEDTQNGIRAAKQAGMLCVAIPCEATVHQDHSEADRQLRSLNELVLSQWCYADNHGVMSDVH